VKPQAKKRAVVLLSGTVAWALAGFAAAGSFDWPGAWIQSAVSVVGMMAGTVLVARLNPGLIEARSTSHKDAKAFDRTLMKIYSVLVFVVPIVAGLAAVRFGWSPLPPASRYAGVALQLAASALVVWTMVSNPWLETHIRIQEERGHRVATGGPYAFIRHPMYAGIILQYLGTPWVLGSAWCFVPVLAIVAIFVVRTVFEDRTLRAELPGYEDYARQTRRRLAPALW
jgi:protein-S-isoprenylcysteine O-methyltransferase Ste14